MRSCVDCLVTQPTCGQDGVGWNVQNYVTDFFNLVACRCNSVCGFVEQYVGAMKFMEKIVAVSAR